VAALERGVRVASHQLRIGRRVTSGGLRLTVGLIFAVATAYPAASATAGGDVPEQNPLVDGIVLPGVPHERCLALRATTRSEQITVECDWLDGTTAGVKKNTVITVP
jgi:hypothetical protein